MKKHFLWLFLCFFALEIVAQSHSGVSLDLLYGRCFNFSGNKDLTKFMEGYTAVNKATLSKKGNHLAFNQGFEFNGRILINKLSLECAYTRFKANSTFEYNNGDKRDFNLKTGGIRLGIGSYLGSNSFRVEPSYAMIIGKQSLETQFQAVVGSPNTGALLNGNYTGLCVYNEFGLGIEVPLYKFLAFYTRPSYVLPFIPLDLSSDGKYLAKDYQSFVANTSAYDGEYVQDKWNGFQLSIGLILRLTHDN